MRKLLSVSALAWIVTSAGFSHAAEPAYREDIEKRTDQNNDFRHVLFTGKNVQLVAMALKPGENIGEEVHPKVDQCFFFTKGTAQAVLDGQPSNVGKNDVVCVPAGTRHDIRNTGAETLKLFTSYSPPQHPPGTVHHTKADAARAEKAAPKSE
jgi:mannose-6-phosphate isomerase-like protein (cupin superfamily)